MGDYHAKNYLKTKQTPTNPLSEQKRGHGNPALQGFKEYTA